MKYRMEKSFSGSRVHMEYMEIAMSMCHSFAPTSSTILMPSPVLNGQP